MKRIILLLAILLVLVGSVRSQTTTQNARRIISGTGVPSGACNVGPIWTSFYFRTSTGVMYYCSGASTWSVFATAGGGVGTVTVVGAGSLTSTALVTGGGTTTLQTPSATSTLDTSGNLAHPGTLRMTVNGALSSGAGPAIQANGTWITGGSATTNKPYFLVEPTGTTSTGWNTSGTGLGVNAVSGFTGNFADFQLAGASSFKFAPNLFTLNGGGDPTIRMNKAASGSAGLILKSDVGAGLSGAFLSSAGLFGWGATDASIAPDTNISRNAAGIVQAGTTAANSLGSLKALTYLTDTNCSDSAGAAACGSASAGSVVIDAGSTSVVVSTTSVTANSQITPTFDSSLGTRLSVTCNTTAALPTISARTAGTSFTITVAVAPITNPACYGYTIRN